MCNDIPDWAFCADPYREAMDYEENARYDRYDGWDCGDGWDVDDYCPDCSEIGACYCVPLPPPIMPVVVVDDEIPF